MSIIIVALPKIEDAKRIRRILTDHGFENIVSCNTASAALIEANRHQRGLVISSYKLPDMHYSQLAQCIPDYFEMLLIGSATTVSAAGSGIMAITTPVKIYEPGQHSGADGRSGREKIQESKEEAEETLRAGRELY